MFTCVCTSVGTAQWACAGQRLIGRSQLSPPRDPAEVILLGGKQLYLQSHCADRWVTSLTLNINQNPTLIWFLEVIPAHQFPP